MAFAGTLLLLSLLAVLAAPGARAVAPVRSAEPGASAGNAIHLEVEPLLGSTLRYGQWVAFRVRVTNDGPAVDGELRIAARHKGASSYGVPVEVATGARQEHILYGAADWYGGRYRVQLTDGDRVVASQDVGIAAMDEEALGVAIVAEEPGRMVTGLRRAILQRGGRSSTTSQATPTDLPPRAEAWAGVDLVLWQDQPATDMTAEQRTALAAWVANGGDLVIVGGSMGPQGLAGLPPELLPFQPDATIDVPASELVGLLGDVPAGMGSLPALTGPLRQGTLLAGTPDAAIAARLAVGRGTVTVVGIDPWSPVLDGTTAATALWSQVLPGTLGPGVAAGSTSDRGLTASLSTIPAVSTPRPEQLLFLFLAYVLLLGPVNYLVLRRLDRLELAWITMPALIALFAAGAFLFGVVLKGSSVATRQLAIVRTAAGATHGSAEVQVGVFAPSRGRFDVTVPGDTFVSPVAGRRTAAQAYRVLNGNPARLVGLTVEPGAQAAFRADTDLPALGLTSDLRLEEDWLRGTVTNASDAPIEDVAVLFKGVAEPLGTLAPGETRTVEARAFGTAPNRRLLAGRLFPKLPSPDQATLAVRTTRLALLRHASGNRSWRDAFSVSGSDGPVLLGWRSGPVLDVEVGTPAAATGEALYIVETPLTLRGPVSFGGSAMEPAVLGMTAAGGGVRGSIHTLSEGTMTELIRPAAFTGRLAPTELAIRLAPTLVAPVGDLVDVAPLPATDQPDQADPVGSGPPTPPLPDGEANLPALQLYDRVAKAWVELPPLDRQTSYRVADPERYVDASGALQVRYVNRRSAPLATFALSTRLKGTAS